MTPGAASFEDLATVDCSVRRVRARFREWADKDGGIRIQGVGKSNPDLILRRYGPVCAVDLFGATYFLSGYLYDEGLGYFVGFFAPQAPRGRPRSLYARIFYKDSSLMWRVASHFVHDTEEYWIGKGDVRTVHRDGDEWLSTIEESTNLPLEVQSAFDVARTARAAKWDERAAELILRRGPSGRIHPYADFTAPRRRNTVRINRGRPIARFTTPGDPTSLTFTRGYEPDLEGGVVERSLTQSQFFGGELHKVRVLSTNRKIQYMFFASPTHAWLNPPQALTRELSTYGVRLVDVEAPDDLFVPGYEYHEEDEDGRVTHSQIPDGYAGDPHPDDPHRADASRWLEALPVIQEFRKRVLLLPLLLLMWWTGGVAGQERDGRAGVLDAGEVTTVLRTSRLLDGTGEMLLDRDVVVRDGRIVAVVPGGEGEGDRIEDLRGMTVLPGLIDTHVHTGWHFDESGRLARGSAMEERVLHAAENAYRMLSAGFTTVQSLGGEEDGPLADALERGILPGPRILTSLGSLSARTGGPEDMRAAVRDFADQGAHVIKIFGSESIRTGGAPTLSQEQLDAACGEASVLGLRAVVHAHGNESARRASLAGCTTIEHGALLDRATLEFLAERGTFYDPNIHLIFQNYFDNEDRYLGIGGYTEEGFDQMRAAVPRALEAFRTALTVPGLKTVFGTDAVAGAHGRNGEELVYRVQVGRQSALDAITSATSLAAESLGLEDEIGRVQVGWFADLIAVEGDPTQDIQHILDVRWVMKSGRVIRSRP